MFRLNLSPLFHEASWLSANAIGAAGFGSVFWAIAARRFEPDQVGLAVALFSAATLLGLVGELGLTNAAVRYIRSADTDTSAAAILGTGGGLSVLVSLAAAFVFALIGVAVFNDPLTAETAILLPVLSAASALAFFLDFVFVGLGRTHLLLARTLAFGTLRILLLLLSDSLSLSLFEVWVISQVVIVAALVPVAAKACGGIAWQPSWLKQVRAFLGSNYIASWLNRSPGYVLSILAARYVSSNAAAYFFAAWSLASLIYILPGNVGMAVFARWSRSRGDAEDSPSKGLGIGLLLTLPVVAVTVAAPEAPLLLFGQTYGTESAASLRLLALAALALVPLHLCAAKAKAVGDNAAILLLALLPAGVTYGGSILLIPQIGAEGMAVAWLISQTVSGLLALPYLRGRRARGAV